MKISKKGLIRAGIAISIVWTLIVSGVTYLQYEVLSGGGVGISLTQPDHRYSRKHYWFFDLYTRLLNDEEALRFSSGVNPFGDPKVDLGKSGFTPIDENEVPWKVDDLSPIKVLVLNANRFLFTSLGPLIVLWVAGTLLAWVSSGFNGTEPEEVSLSQPAPEYTESDTLAKNEIERSKALGFNGTEAMGTPLVQPIPENHESDSLDKNEDKKPKSWALIALHAWGGICLNAVFNLSKIHVGALLAVGSVILGYAASKYLVARIDALLLTKKVRNAVVISLVPLYFLILVALGALIRIIRGLPL